MADVAILVPSLRTSTWERITENVRDTAPGAEVVFLGEEYPTYAKAINAGWKLTDARYLFTSADDTVFSEGWLEACLEVMGDGVCVVGTNDLHNPYVLAGEHSTHTLFDREYIETLGAVIDEGPGSFLHEGYDHGYVDSEAVETARARGVFAPCLDAIAEHLHPAFGTRDVDDVTIRTRRRWHADWQLFMRRRRLWEDRLDVVHDYDEPPLDA